MQLFGEDANQLQQLTKPSCWLSWSRIDTYVQTDIALVLALTINEVICSFRDHHSEFSLGVRPL